MGLTPPRLVGAQLLAQQLRGLVHLRLVRLVGGRDVGQVVAGHVVGGKDVDVRVGHFEAGDEVAGARRTVGVDKCLSDLFGHLVHVGPQGGREVGPLVHLLDGHNEGVAVGDRLDGQKRSDRLVAVDEAAGQLPVQDLGEYCAHARPGYR